MTKAQTLWQLAQENEELFIQWAQLWHGDHDSKSQHKDCHVYLMLKDYNNQMATVESVLDTVIDEDHDWEESWEQFLKDKGVMELSEVNGYGALAE